MRRYNHFRISIAAVLFLFVILVCLPITHDEVGWRWARTLNSVESYGAYLKARPQGRHAPEAAARQDDLAWAVAKASQSLNSYGRYAQEHPNGQHVAEAQGEVEKFIWQQAVAGNSVAGYEDFLSKYGQGRFAPEARARMEELKWQQAKSARTLRLIRGYLAAYPQGKHAAEARKLEESLQLDEKPLQAALNAQSEKALRNFLTEYPGHSQETEARQALKDFMEGRDVLDLIADKKIEAYAVGNGAQTILVKLKRLSPGALTVHIPVGSYFESDMSKVQNMVAMEERKVRLDGDFWTEVEVPVVSVNYSKDEPDFDHTFKFKRLPDTLPVMPLLPVLQKADAAFPVWQAAFWIATDNANFEHLGVLTVHPGGFLLENERVIKEADAARAMKLCEDAGMDITQKKIWKKSRTEILNGLKDAELKKWMESKPVAEK